MYPTRPPAVRDVDLVVLEDELRELMDAARTSIFDAPEFRGVPTPLQRIVRVTENRLHRRILGRRR